MEIVEKAFAKLNLSLDILGKRDDGFHDVSMVMQTVSLYDRITMTFTSEPGVSATSTLRYIPGDQRNLAVKAAMLYFEAIGEPDTGLQIDIEKHIPVGAGMGGGSCDAAAVLRGLNRYYGNRLSVSALKDIAAQIGSDVVFCLVGGTQFASGRGEILSALPALPDCRIVICKPSFSFSTPEFYAKSDKARLRRHPDTAGILASLEMQDLSGIGRRMYNVFEDVNDRKLRTISAIKSKLIDYGAIGAVMTGTGSAVFGLFAPDADTDAAWRDLEAEYGFCISTRPIGKLL